MDVVTRSERQLRRRSDELEKLLRDLLELLEEVEAGDGIDVNAAEGEYYGRLQSLRRRAGKLLMS